MTREQFQEKYKLSLPLKTRKEFEAARRRMGALTKDEKAILSAIVLQKGEAEAGEIFANSPERLRDYTILKGVNSYAALGRYYLANETTVPEELYEYMDLGALGCRYEDEHPGVFIGSDKYPELNKKLDEIAEKYGVSATTIAVAWLLRHPANFQPIIGTMNLTRLADCVKACDIQLTRQEWYDIYLSAGNMLP